MFRVERHLWYASHAAAVTHWEQPKAAAVGKKAAKAKKKPNPKPDGDPPVEPAPKPANPEPKPEAELDNRIFSSAQPFHPNSPRLAQQGVFAAHVSVRRRERFHSRSPERMAHPLWGLRSSSWYGADKAMLNSAVPNRYRMQTPATSAGFTSTSTTCDSAVHPASIKHVHKRRSWFINGQCRVAE